MPATALRSQSIASSLVFQILELLTSIHSDGGEVKLLWVPSYVGVEGNERADEAAKATSRFSRIRSLGVEADDMKAAIGHIILAE